jgi:hypothetical protein
MRRVEIIVVNRSSITPYMNQDGIFGFFLGPVKGTL